MNAKRGLGLIVILVGILVIVVQSVSLTGAVINISAIASNAAFGIGLALIIGGIVLFTTETSERTYRSPVQEIWDQTTQFLKEHGLDYSGRSKNERDFEQDEFERSMRTGAFSSQRSRHH